MYVKDYVIITSVNHAAKKVNRNNIFTTEIWEKIKRYLTRLGLLCQNPVKSF